MKDYTIINKGQQTLVVVDSGLFKELLNLAIYAKGQLKINDPEWFHSPGMYKEMLNNHNKVMSKAIHLAQGEYKVSID